MVLAESYFDSLCSALFPHGTQRRQVVILRQAYFDETGTQDDSFLMVGGLIASADNWQLFNRKWLELMGSEEAARSFKAKNCRDDDLLGRAAQLAWDHSDCGFVISICPSEYEQATSSRFRSQIGSAYTLCLKDATAKVGDWADRGNMSEPISYFFDAGHRNQEQANEYFRRVFTRMPHERVKIRLGSWTFADDRLVWPLKAAEILALTHYRWEYRSLDTPAREVFHRQATRIIIRTHLTLQEIQGLVAQLEELYADRRSRRSGTRRSD